MFILVRGNYFYLSHRIIERHLFADSKIKFVFIIRRKLSKYYAINVFSIQSNPADNGQFQGHTENIFLNSSHKLQIIIKNVLH